MNNWMYTLYALVLGIISLFTGEVITFIMLGMILITLVNINTNIKKIAEKEKK